MVLRIGSASGPVFLNFGIKGRRIVVEDTASQIAERRNDDRADVETELLSSRRTSIIRPESRGLEKVTYGAVFLSEEQTVSTF